MNRNSKNIKRRLFIERTAAAAAGITILPASIVSGFSHSGPSNIMSEISKVNSSSAVFVKHGKAILLDDYFLYGHVRKENNYLAVYSSTREKSPQYNKHYCNIGLLAGRAIRDGDFHVSACLRPILMVKKEARLLSIY